MAYRACAVLNICVLILAGCGGAEPVQSPPRGTAGTGGIGVPATGGTGGSGATGAGGEAGQGGVVGNGGTSGTGGVGGSAGTGGTGGIVIGPCGTNTLCQECPDQFLCNSDDDCFVGWDCIPTGCTDLGGSVIHQCEPNAGGFCQDDDDCPTPSAPDPDYTCEAVQPGPTMRCVKQTPGCNNDFDCVLGFSCESGDCVDRRVPCIRDDDCPVSYSCEEPNSNRFCARIYQTCETDLDCGVLAPYCEDIDGDGKTECAGSLGLNGPACLNSSCGGSTPVCEASGVGSLAACGQYGLCLNDGDCAAGFTCKGMWLDGRKECVPSGGSCDFITDCPVNQVCASPRDGGSPSCQSGAM